MDHGVVARGGFYGTADMARVVRTATMQAPLMIGSLQSISRPLLLMAGNPV